MTISTSYSFNPQADQIVKQAFQSAGILALGRTPRTDQLNDARDLLTIVLKEMQAKGMIQVTTERKTLTLSPGVTQYTLDADTIDVEFPTTYSAPGSTSEQIVERMSYSDYAPLSDKTAQGTPTRVYVEKTSVLTASFWTTPSEAGTWHYRRVRMIRDMSDGSTTLDLTPKYIQVMVWKLAHRLALASGVGLPRVQYLESQVLATQAEVMGDDNERGEFQICLADPYGRY